MLPLRISDSSSRVCVIITLWILARLTFIFQLASDFVTLLQCLQLIITVNFLFCNLTNEIHLWKIHSKTSNRYFRFQKKKKRKKLFEVRLEILCKHTICTGVCQWRKSLMMTVKVEFSCNKYCWTWSEIFVQSFESRSDLFACISNPI